MDYPGSSKRKRSILTEANRLCPKSETANLAQDIPSLLCAKYDFAVVLFDILFPDFSSSSRQKNMIVIV